MTTRQSSTHRAHIWSADRQAGTTRRAVLRRALIASGALAGAHLLPERWMTPIIGRIVVPAHAETSGTTDPADPPTGSLKIFYNPGSGYDRIQSFVVPAGVTRLTLEVVGAKGGGGGGAMPALALYPNGVGGDGGNGAAGQRINATLMVSPGETLTIQLGLGGGGGGGATDPGSPGVGGAGGAGGVGADGTVADSGASGISTLTDMGGGGGGAGGTTRVMRGSMALFSVEGGNGGGGGGFSSIVPGLPLDGEHGIDGGGGGGSSGGDGGSGYRPTTISIDEGGSGGGGGDSSGFATPGLPGGHGEVTISY
ncbi:MAG: hypothetical protein KQH59_03810 [Desulfobulbaceae bacterium]|nr:hypothetical protein [Desulfobulbaceae bacterium]